MSDTAPRLSPDGQWWWDGAGWIPAQRSTEPPPPPPTGASAADHVVATARMHPLASAYRHLIWLAPLIAFFFLVSLSINSYFGTIALVLLVPAALFGLAGRLQVAHTRFEVTTRQARFETGILNRNSSEIPLRQIEAVNVSQGLSGRAFGFGTLVVIGSGGTRQVFAGVRAPHPLRTAMQQQITT